MSGIIPPPPPTQALTSTTFVPPPLDLSLTAAETIDFHRIHSPNHVAYVYEDASGECKQITFSTWVRAIHRAVRQLRAMFELPEPQVDVAKPVISLLANSGKAHTLCFSLLSRSQLMRCRLDTITYGTAMLGIIRTECVAFAISPRNSAAGVAHLINKTGSQYITVTPDLKPLVDAGIAILKKQGSKIPEVQLMPIFKDLFPDDDSEDFEYLPEPKSKSADDLVCILHSSGMSRHPRSVIELHNNECYSQARSRSQSQ